MNNTDKMLDVSTKMRAEIQEIPDAIQRFFDNSLPAVEKAAEQMRAIEPDMFITVARGSSDHAATYLKYSVELLSGLPVASIGPSVSSIYGKALQLKKAVCISISQSGQSPDIVQLTSAACAGGAMAVGITNHVDSRLAGVSDHIIGMQAGKESSVAATKTFVTSVVAGLALLAHWQQDKSLISALNELPDLTSQAISCDWNEASKCLLKQDALLVLGRGPSFAIAGEVALKFKETCQIQGEAFSSAEVQHGPMSIVTAGYPVLVMAAADAAESSTCKLADELAMRDARVFVTSDNVDKAVSLPNVKAGHALVDPLLKIVSFYSFVEELARLRGLNPDEPQYLKKVTETV